MCLSQRWLIAAGDGGKPRRSRWSLRTRVCFSACRRGFKARLSPGNFLPGNLLLPLPFFRGGFKAQCYRPGGSLLDPFAQGCRFVARLKGSSGGIRSSSSWLVMRARSSEASGLPGMIGLKAGLCGGKDTFLAGKTKPSLGAYSAVALDAVGSEQGLHLLDEIHCRACR